MTPAQIEQRRQAGKASYRALIRRLIERYGTHDQGLDKAAQHLSGCRRAWGFTHKRGVTRAYLRRWATDLGLVTEERF